MGKVIFVVNRNVQLVLQAIFWNIKKKFKWKWQNEVIFNVN